MRINEVNLGNGLFRLNVEKTCGEANPPQSVMDEIMRDVVNRMNGKKTTAPCGCGRNPWAWQKPAKPTTPCGCGKPRSHAELDCLNRFGEPDGFDAHIDRPVRENFCSHQRWADAMAKYRVAEDAVKACDWPAKEEPKWAPVTPKGPIWRPTPKPVCKPVAPKPSKPTICECNRAEAIRALDVLAKLLLG